MNAKVWSVVISIVVTPGHVFLQFVAWSIAPGNTAPSFQPGWFSENAWAIVSFPLLSLTSKTLATIYFWPLMLGHSAIWGLLIGLLSYLLFRKYSIQPHVGVDAVTISGPRGSA
jgi:hypothetical protein